METTVKNNNGITEIFFEGEMSILDAMNIKTKLLETVKDAKEIVINHEKTNDIDLTYIQILAAFSQTVKENNIEMKIIDSENKLLDKVLELTGMQYLFSTEQGVN